MKRKKRKCNNCHEYFIPDKYNYHSQEYCTKAECRRVSKINSRRKYRLKDENRTPKKLREESERVKKYQKKHPDYKKSKKSSKKNSETEVLRDIAPAETEVLRDIAQLKNEVLRIEQLEQTITYYKHVTAGLTSVLTGDGLRDIISNHLDRYYDIGTHLPESSSGSIRTNIKT